MIFACWVLTLLILAGQEEPPVDCLKAAEARREGNLVQAESLLQQCRSKNPEIVLPYLWLSALYQQQGREDDLYSLALTAIDRFPDEKRFYYVVGARAGRDGRCEEAAEVFARAHERWPAEGELKENLVQAYLCSGKAALDTGENARAIESLQPALALEPLNLDALLNLGRAQQNLQMSADALVSFDKVAALDPQTPMIQFHRAVALNAMGRFDECTRILTAQLKSTPNHGPSYYFRGLAFLYRGDWEPALADFKRAVEIMPDFGDAVYRLGRCLDHFGKDEEAEEAFRRTLTLDPEDGRPMWALGNLLARTGRQKEADELLQRAVDLYERRISPAQGEARFQFNSDASAKP